MTSIQTSAHDGRIPLSIVAAVVAAAFALGAVIGFGLPRIVEGIGHTTGSAVVAPTVTTVVAPRDMSDAAYEARIGAAAAPTAPTVVATRPRDMSDDAYDALHVPTGTMSDAAYAAMHPASNVP
jgi:hypothetical protein